MRWLLRSGTASITGLALLFALAGCSGGSYAMLTNHEVSSPAALDATPASVAFGLGATPAPIMLRSNVLFQSFEPVYVSDPQVVGASEPVVTGALTATFTLYPIAQGPSAYVKVTDSSHASATVTKTQEPCGRPPELLSESQLIYPPRGAKNVPFSIDTIYFSVIDLSQTATAANLHIIVGKHATLEGGALYVAAPPPGTKIPPPPMTPGEFQHLEAARVPKLQPGTTYRTEIYNDPCQLPVLPGGFST